MKKNDRYWCWWKSSYLLFQEVTSTGEYKFIDFGDVHVTLSEKEFLELKKC